VTESIAQLEQLWIEAGGPIGAAPQAAAIATAESRGNPTAYNATQASGDQSFGLWQINTAPGAHTQWKGQVTAQDNTSIFNPLQNAKDALALYSGTGGFTGPWAAEFVAGSPAAARYQAALAQAPDPTSTAVSSAVPAAQPQTPLQAAPGNAANAVVGAVSGAGTAAGNAISGAVSGPLATLQTSWATFWNAHPATLVIAGIVLLLVAFALIAGQTIQNTVQSLPAAAAAA
jgi:hypothetical protein